jgi:hypothetical protein
MFDLNVPLHEDDWEKDGNQLLKESSEPLGTIAPQELLPSDDLHPISVCSGNTCSTLQCTVATGQTTNSKESDGDGEVQSQSQEFICSPCHPFALSSMVYDTWEEAKVCYDK